MNTIAIVGGAGFVGSALAQHLSSSYRVRILDRNKPKSTTCDFLACDIRNYDEVETALKDVDLVIHTAIVQIPAINQERRLGYQVNIIGTQNACEAVRNSDTAKGLIITGSWHTIGERKIEGVVDEKFGFRPDMIEDRARLYALSKIGQEVVVRMYDEADMDKTFGIIRIGTVLGMGMQPQSAANLFIENGLKGLPLTPYEHSMHRPMLYVDIRDICHALESFVRKILHGTTPSKTNSVDDVYNVYFPEPVTILELAHMVKQSLIDQTSGRINPEIKIVSTGKAMMFSPGDKLNVHVDATRMHELLGSWKLTSPSETIERLVRDRLSSA